MKHFRWMLLAVLLTPAVLAGQGVSIGVINFNRAITESAAGQAAAVEWQAYYDTLAAQLQATQQKIAEEQQQLQIQQGALSAAVLNERTRAIQNLQTQLQRESEDAEEAVTLKEDELFRPVVERVQQILQEYAAEQRFTLILDSQAGIVYAAPSADITNEIIRRMDMAASAGTPQP